MLLPSRLRNSLLARTVTFTLLVVAGAGVVISAIFLMAIRGLANKHLELRAAAVTRFVAIRAQFPMLVGDRTELERLATETLSMEDVGQGGAGPHPEPERRVEVR